MSELHTVTIQCAPFSDYGLKDIPILFHAPNVKYLKWLKYYLHAKTSELIFLHFISQ